MSMEEIIADLRESLNSSRELIRKFEREARLARARALQTFSGFGHIAWGISSMWPTPDYYILEHSFPLYTPGWAWLCICIVMGLLQVSSSVSRSQKMKVVTSLLSAALWGVIWLTLLFFHGGVTSVALIPVFLFATIRAYFLEELT